MDNATFPSRFEERMHQYLGDEWESFALAHQQDAPVSVRYNPDKPIPIPSGDAIPWAPDGRYLAERPLFTLDPALHAGAYYVQEASSMLLQQAIEQTVNLKKPLVALDLCAAPGGKSTHLLSLLSPSSLLVSNEVIRPRSAVLLENLQKWGAPNMVVTNNDPKDFAKLNGFFDMMVIDAPCSGEGLFRKEPQATREWSVDNAALCADRQRRILSDVWPALKEDGLFIYCTCTYNEAENEQNMQWLQQDHEVEFRQLEINPAWGIREISAGNMIGYACYPHHARGEGFFISVMQKKTTEPIVREKTVRSINRPPNKISDALRPWLTTPEYYALLHHKSDIHFFPELWLTALESLKKNLYLLVAGTPMATLKHEKIVPEHAMALSIALRQKEFSIVDVDMSQALRYLRKEPIDVVPTRRGYALIRYNGLPLGWLNILPNRVNNLYPTAWRIRMSGTPTSS